MGNDFYNQSILPWAPIIIKICRAYTNSQEEFEDFYQEVSLQIWRSRDNFTGQSEWSTWIYRLSLNVCLTNMRNNKKQQEKLKSASMEALPEPQNYKEPWDKIDQLYTAIHQLREVDRAVILLYLEEKTYNEIADIIGTNANNIGVRITRIKERLTKLLANKENANE